MSSHRVLVVEIPIYNQTTSVAGDATDLALAAASPGGLFNYVAKLCQAAVAGSVDAGIVVRSLGVNLPTAAFASFTCTRASWTAGDILRFVLPTGEWVDCTAVAGTPNPLLGQYAQGASTDTHLAVSVREAINANNRLNGWFRATGSTNNIVLTAVKDSPIANSIKVQKIVTTAGVFSFTTNTAFTGALAVFDATTASKATVTFDEVATANDTLVIGPVTLTWKASASTENEVTIGASTAAAATNLIAKINAHSILKNYVVAATGGASIANITSLYASPAMKAWTITKTGTYTPTIAGQLFPTTVTLEGADLARAQNIR